MATPQAMTGKQKANAAKAAAAKSGQAAPEEKKREAKIVPVLKAGALSVDVGPAVVRAFSQANADELKGQELIASANTKRYEQIGNLTLAIVKAAKADGSIDLTATTKQGPEGTKAMVKLNDQLHLALGIKQVVTSKKGSEEVKTLAYTSAVAPFFPAPGEKDSAKQTLRSNFSHTLKKCSMAALGIIERNITAKMDKKVGTLLLSGPTIKKEFGTDSVHLNEKQTVPGKKEGEEIKLKEKPSFTAIAAMAARDHGAEVHRGSNTRGAGKVGASGGAGGALIDPVKALQSLADSVVKACEKIKQPNDAQITALEKMNNAIEKVLDGRQ